MTRERLPLRRYNENEEIDFNGLTVAVSFGFTDDARIGEVFLSTRKVGTAFDTAVRDLAVMMSLGLQYGITPSVMARTLTANEAGEAEGLAGRIVEMMQLRLAEIGDLS